MNNYNAVNWFEIAVQNLERAQNFYETVFNVRLQEANGQPGIQMVMFPGAPQQAGAMGALICSAYTKPNDTGTVVYFQCHDLQNELQRAEQHGGKVLMPKTSIGENGFIAHFCDTEGNRIGLHSMQ